MKKHCIFLTISLIISFSFTKICAQLQFISHTITGGTLGADGAIAVYAIDMDDDGDIDILSASWNDDKIAWYENDGNENFALHAVTTNAERASSVYGQGW